jgi:hypothetical protein
MTPAVNIEVSRKPAVSELMLSDRLIALAEAADHAGYTDTAERLVTLACSVFDEARHKPH